MLAKEVIMRRHACNHLCRCCGITPVRHIEPQNAMLLAFDVGEQGGKFAKVDHVFAAHARLPQIDGHGQTSWQRFLAVLQAKVMLHPQMSFMTLAAPETTTWPDARHGFRSRLKFCNLGEGTDGSASVFCWDRSGSCGLGSISWVWRWLKLESNCLL